MATVSGWDRQHGFDDAVSPDTYDSDRITARQEWQASVNAYEDGLSDVDPGAFDDWF